MQMEKEVVHDLKCYHCGQACDEVFWISEKPFCCFGCKTVFEVLNENDLCDYYALDKNPGVKRREVSEETYAYLEEASIRKKILEFDAADYAKVRFNVPAIHCVSCIWLLENLQKLNEGVLKSEVNFAKKRVLIHFNPRKISLSEIARLLSIIGYTPQINLDSQEDSTPKTDKSMILKLAIAGFCFGNVMLFSFPEYLGLDHQDQHLVRIFSWLNLALSVPVFVFSARDYFSSAIHSFKQRQINIDVPIAVGLLALFFRSAYDIISGTGPGYMDSFTGLVFFLLIGRWFQSKTYESLAFDRDFTSYFPLAVNRLQNSTWKPVVIYELKKGDQIRVRNMEIIPADSILTNDVAYIDYSFVTGESKPVKVKQSELIYAGGRLVGTPVQLIVQKKTSQSHLTSLWNNEVFKKITESKYKKTIDRAARIFTIVVLLIAVVTGIYWQFANPAEMWLVLTSVLMVACPCALALAAPFTYGSMLRVFGKHHLYLKNADVIERMASIDTVVFDKTGTVTHGSSPSIVFHGSLTADELKKIKTLTGYSTHPLSSLIHNTLKYNDGGDVSEFKEIPAKGMQGILNGLHIKIGSASFVTGTQSNEANGSQVFVAIDHEVRGYFSIHAEVRPDIKKMIRQLGDKCYALLSGDNESDKAQMGDVFNPSVNLLFNQTPHDKLNYIEDLQRLGKHVMMIGDGLNDAGALKQSDVGIAVSDDTGVFTPSSDGILSGDNLFKLASFLDLARTSTIILKIGFCISFFYNAIALSFAVTGHLTPLVAAVLMPVSSITVVSFSSLAVNFVAKRKLNVKKNLL